MYKVQWVQKRKKSQVYLGRGCHKSSQWEEDQGRRWEMQEIKAPESVVSLSFHLVYFQFGLVPFSSAGDYFSRYFKSLVPSCQLSPHLVCSGPSKRHSGGGRHVTLFLVSCPEDGKRLHELPQPAKIVASFTILANMSTLWSLVCLLQFYLWNVLKMFKCGRDFQ